MQVIMGDDSRFVAFHWVRAYNLYIPPGIFCSTTLYKS